MQVGLMSGAFGSGGFPAGGFGADAGGGGGGQQGAPQVSLAVTMRSAKWRDLYAIVKDSPPGVLKVAARDELIKRIVKWTVIIAIAAGLIAGGAYLYKKRKKRKPSSKVAAEAA